MGNVGRAGRRAPVAIVLLAVLASTVVTMPHAGAAVVPERLAGPDRYATAALAASMASAHDHVVVATGVGFADALVAGASRPDVGLLLTAPTSLPAATAERLATWRPGLVEVVGGPAAIADGVVTEIRGLTGGEVVRRAGADRYATAAELAPSAPVGHVLVASGTNFPDALAGVPLAIRTHAALVLTAPDALPDATRAVLARLAPTQVTILGGPAAVSDSVAAAIQDVTGVAATRLAGDDRFATAARIALTAPAAADTAYVATGLGFADALAVGPVSGGAPVLLTDPAVLPTVTACALHALSPARVVVVGGRTAVNDEVAVEAGQAVAVRPSGCPSGGMPEGGGGDDPAVPDPEAPPPSEEEPEPAPWPGLKPQESSLWLPCPDGDGGVVLPEVPTRVGAGTVIDRGGSDLELMPDGKVAALGVDEVFVLDPGSAEVVQTWPRPPGTIDIQPDDTGRLWAHVAVRGQPSQLAELRDDGTVRTATLPVEALSVAVVGPGDVAVVVAAGSDGPTLEVRTSDASVLTTWTTARPGRVHRIPGTEDVLANSIGRRYQSDGHVVADVAYAGFDRPLSVSRTRVIASGLSTGLKVLDGDTLVLEGTLTGGAWVGLEPTGGWAITHTDQGLEVFDAITTQPNLVVTGLSPGSSGVWTGTHVVEAVNHQLRVVDVRPVDDTGRRRTPADGPVERNDGTWTDVPGTVHEIVAVPATGEFWVTNPELDRVDVLDGATGRPDGHILVGDAPSDLEVTADGRVAVALSGTASVALIDPSSRAVSSVLLQGGDAQNPMRLAALPDQLLVTTDSGSRAVAITGTTTSDTDYVGWGLTTSPNGRWVVTSTHVWDRATGEDRRLHNTDPVEQVLDDGRLVLDDEIIDTHGRPIALLDPTFGRSPGISYSVSKDVAVDTQGGVAWAAYRRGLVAHDVQRGFAVLSPRIEGGGCVGGEYPTGVAALPGGDRVAVTYPQGVAIVHVGPGDLTRQRPPAQLTATALGWVDHASPLRAHGGTVAGDTAWFAYPQHGWIAGFDVRNGRRTRLLDMGGQVPSDVDVLDDGDLVVALQAAGVMRIDQDTGRRTFLARGHYEQIARLADGRLLAGRDDPTTTDGSGDLISLDGTVEELVCCIQSDVDVSPQRSWGVMTGFDPYRLADGGSPQRVAEIGTVQRSVAISDDGTTLRDGHQVIERDGSVRTLPGGTDPVAASFLAQSALAIRHGVDVHVIDTDSGQKGPALPGPGWSRFFDAHDQWIMTGRDGGELIDVEILHRSYAP